MFTNRFLFLLIGLFLLISQETSAQDISLQQISTNLNNPTTIVSAGDGTGRLFITEQEGTILIYDGNQILGTPFLNIQSKVLCCGERGLLGLAFHPNYSSNGLFYVNYTDNIGNTVVERYTVSGNPNVANANSDQFVITYNQPASNHNGGHIAFGPDGLLYISSGDGGGNPGSRAQETTNLLGKILRIDVNNDDFPGDPNKNYSIPTSNPFSNEIWVYGLRNPWKFSFDNSGNLFIGDVGEGTNEEISYKSSSSPGGENYGWQCFEGNSVFDNNCPQIVHTPPIIQYTHASGNCSVTGGFRYRGSQIPDLSDDYIYGDFCSGRIWHATEISPGNWSESLLINSSLSIAAFGEDDNGELYIADNPFSGSGGIFKIINNQPTPQFFNLGVAVTGNGEGNINGNGISCGSAGNDCSEENIEEDTQVQLAAEPDQDSTFGSWSGDCSGSNTVFTLTFNEDKFCSTNFTLNSQDDDGDGVLNEDDNCPLDPNPGQEDSDNDGIGDDCDNNDSGMGEENSDMGDGAEIPEEPEPMEDDNSPQVPPVTFIQDSGFSSEQNSLSEIVVSISTNGEMLQDVVINIDLPDGIIANDISLFPASGECVIDDALSGKIEFPNIMCSLDTLQGNINLIIDIFITDQNVGTLFILFELISSSFPNEVFEGTARVTVAGVGTASSCTLAGSSKDTSPFLILLASFGLVVLRRRFLN